MKHFTYHDVTSPEVTFSIHYRIEVVETSCYKALLTWLDAFSIHYRIEVVET